jgi:hypothetical protein
MPYGTVNADVITTSTAGGVLGAGDASTMKNRIINGAMVIDQRNAGASVTPTLDGSYTLDRWGVGLTAASKFSVQQNAGSVTPPVGFSNYLGVTSLAATSLGATDYYILYQKIEGFNFADLGFGTANAKTVTLSFQVRSSLTGTFGGSLANESQNRNYPFSYSIPVANTWTTISVTIAGDTTGTWTGATNSIGAILRIGLGVGSTWSGTAGAWTGSSYIFAPTGATSVVGTNGATFYITGVQLEVGSSATGFEYRQYTTELSLCQRYYYLWASGSPKTLCIGGYYASNYLTSTTTFPVTMRTAPSLVQATGTNYYGAYTNSTLDTFDSFDAGIQQPTPQTAGIDASSGISGTSGSVARLITNNASASLAFNAEL